MIRYYLSPLLFLLLSCGSSHTPDTSSTATRSDWRTVKHAGLPIALCVNSFSGLKCEGAEVQMVATNWCKTVGLHRGGIPEWISFNQNEYVIAYQYTFDPQQGFVFKKVRTKRVLDFIACEY